MVSVKDKVVFITGGARGIGAETARQLHAKGATVVVTDLDEPALHDLIGTSFLAPDTTNEFASMPGNFAHSQRIALVDAQGKIVSYFDGLTEKHWKPA